MFKIADNYAEISRNLLRTMRERGGPFPHSERHLHCVWFDPLLRPASLTTDLGHDVRVIRPGRWNLEAGPDFLDAVLEVDGHPEPLHGDVEVHIHPLDWTAHGHAGDPAYRNVIAHVTYFEGSLEPRVLPSEVLQVALRPCMPDTDLTFESIDITAYPYAATTLPSPLAEHVAGWNPDEIEALLDAAGAERIRRKAECLRIRIARTTEEQALYEDVMGALGYKLNSIPFRLLASRVSMRELRTRCKQDPEQAYAILCAVSGLLPKTADPAWDSDTRTFVRRLWDAWWRVQGSYDDGILSSDIWRLARIRPHNHPLRRLAGAAGLCTARLPFYEQLTAWPTNDAPDWIRNAIRYFSETDPIPYWSTRLSLSAPARPKPTALIGRGRAAAIVTNCLIPWLALKDAPAVEKRFLGHLRAEEDNALVRHAAYQLLGPDHNPAMYRNGLRQQGLLQIYMDFCLA